MIAIAFVPVVLAILGALVYALSSNGKVAELGRVTFAAGMFAFAFALATHVVRIGTH